MYIVPVQAAPAPPSFPLSPVRQGSKRGGEKREEQELAAREQVELAMAREQEELHIVAREQEELAMALALSKVGHNTCQYHLSHI